MRQFELTIYALVIAALVGGIVVFIISTNPPQLEKGNPPVTAQILTERSAPDCGNDSTRSLVVRILKDHPPLQFLRIAVDQSPSMRPIIERGNLCGADTSCNARNQEEYFNAGRDLYRSASYSLSVIRMTDRNASTGAVTCAADLHVVMPDGWGRATRPITFKVEKTTVGELYGTIFDLN